MKTTVMPWERHQTAMRVTAAATARIRPLQAFSGRDTEK